MQSVQNAAARLVTGTRRTDHITLVLQSLHWLPVRQRVTFKLVTLAHKCLNGRAPGYLADNFRLAGRGRPGSRSAASMMLDIPRTTTSLGEEHLPSSRNMATFFIASVSLTVAVTNSY